MNNPDRAKQARIEQNKLSDEMRIACCKTCLLSKAMRDCNRCYFNIGLPVQVKPVQTK